MKGGTRPGPPFGINPRPHGGLMDNVAYRNAPRARITPSASGRLSEEHRRVLEEESGISPEVIAARGYYTARKPSELPKAFPRWQRRPGLVVPGFSPSGARFHQYKPKTPIRRKGKPGPKYETPQRAPVML